MEDVGIVYKKHGTNKMAGLEASIWMCYTYNTLTKPPGLSTNEVIKYREMRGREVGLRAGYNHKGSHMLSALKSMSDEMLHGGVPTAGENLY